jgi:hypothetical protein
MTLIKRNRSQGAFTDVKIFHHSRFNSVIPAKAEVKISALSRKVDGITQTGGSGFRPSPE